MSDLKEEIKIAAIFILGSICFGFGLAWLLPDDQLTVANEKAMMTYQKEKPNVTCNSECVEDNKTIQSALDYYDKSKWSLDQVEYTYANTGIIDRIVVSTMANMNSSIIDNNHPMYWEFKNFTMHVNKAMNNYEGAMMKIDEMTENMVDSILVADKLSTELQDFISNYE